MGSNNRNKKKKNYNNFYKICSVNSRMTVAIMKAPNMMWISMVIFAQGRGQAEATGIKTKINSMAIRDIVHQEHRFVLFNSRRLSGECLSVCKETQTASSTTASPTGPTAGPTFLITSDFPH